MKQAIILLCIIVPVWVSCETDVKKDTDKNLGLKTIRIDGGMISGSESADKQVAIFKGIPFAAPPVGSLRWKPPAPVRSWEGIKKCEDFAASPIQPDPVPFYMWSEEFLIPEKPMDEDCLYLNIWAPAIKTETKRPVIVWIHGGGFASGSGSVPIYNGEAMARKGVVFVNFNYRLGIFGFFAHPELTRESKANASGNYGLLDQLAALKWVKMHIEKFGGDPDNITIAGQSAGSASVAFLVASPLSKGLFGKAIAQSGAGLLPRVPGPEGSELNTLEVAEEEGLQISRDLDVPSIDALRDIPAIDLVQKVRFRGHPIMDGYVLPESVSKIYREGRQNGVSLLTGWNEDDGMLIGGGKSAKEYTKEVLSEWGDSGPELLTFYPATNDSIAKISQRYLQRDLAFGVQNYTMANILGEQDQEVFVYRFARDLPDGDQTDYGAFHTGEVPYAYNNLNFVDRPFQPLDYKLADNMSSYWANFAKTGNPNGEGLPLWPTYRKGSREIMVFGDQSRQGSIKDSLQLNFLVHSLMTTKN